MELYRRCRKRMTNLYFGQTYHKIGSCRASQVKVFNSKHILYDYLQPPWDVMFGRSMGRKEQLVAGTIDMTIMVEASESVITGSII